MALVQSLTKCAEEIRTHVGFLIADGHERIVLDILKRNRENYAL